jgi:hypothetical protein
MNCGDEIQPTSFIKAQVLELLSVNSDFSNVGLAAPQATH